MFPLADTLVVSEDAEVNEILAELTSEEPRRALVCDGGRLLGLVSITDTARVLEALSDSGRRTARGRSPVGS
jgi:CBS domain-containing protein